MHLLFPSAKNLRLLALLLAAAPLRAQTPTPPKATDATTPLQRRWAIVLSSFPSARCFTSPLSVALSSYLAHRLTRSK